VDPLLDAGALDDALATASAETRRHLGSLASAPVRHADAEEAALSFGGPLPQEGEGAVAALAELLERGRGAVTGSVGPRYFHFVQGGVTPSALAGDWLASALDQNAGAWVMSPLATRLEVVSLGWLADLFELPRSWGGVFTTGATMANFTCLAAARRWWGERHGVDVEEDGLSGLPSVPVFSSGYIHSSAVKAIAMLGIGRARIRTLERDTVGRLDVEELERALVALDGAPAILVGTAGEVNAGDFDPIVRLAELAERYGAWLHVDGAFGLFARVTPRAASLAAGVERAHSVAVDGHKWLNVPYDCGYAFVREHALLAGAFGAAAAYLPAADDERPSFFALGPEMSRRARALATWATLRAYGRSGYRTMVERHLDLAQRVARRVDEAPDLERLADTNLNVVCFRVRPPGVPESELDTLNARIGEAVLADGRVHVGTTRYGGQVAFRPSIVNWRTRQDDVDLLVDVIRELTASVAAAAGAGR
jgi:glutamate/tyrosine decarboxylase-like PLP-dependent enzyme